MSAPKIRSVYFREPKELRRVKQAAKIRGISANELMRSACVAEAERIIAESKDTTKAA
jgi:uncharacterized protein (DUF1778 family)